MPGDMTPDHVHLDPDSDDLDPEAWMCDRCGRLWSSAQAARACEEACDVRD